MERQFVRVDQLSEFVRKLSGASRKLADVARLAGGSKKGVYRLTLDDGSTSILYVWNDSESYWPASGSGMADPVADASGVDQFVAAHARLQAIEAHLRSLAATVRPRYEYALIHGELGPDHVLVTEDGDPVLARHHLQPDLAHGGQALLRKQRDHLVDHP